MSDLIEEARRRYAEELRFTARLGSRAVIDAFATIPRERFFGPGPWRLLSPMALGEYWTTEDGDPRHLYHDVLIAIDEQRRLNNGQPSLWARMYEDLDLSNGAHVVHVGAPSRARHGDRDRRRVGCTSPREPSGMAASDGRSR